MARRIVDAALQAAQALRAALVEMLLDWCITLGPAKGLGEVQKKPCCGAEVLNLLAVDGPQKTFNEARPLTAFPEAEAVAPTGTCVQHT